MLKPIRFNKGHFYFYINILLMKQRYLLSACLLGISILIGTTLVTGNVSAQTTAASTAVSIQYPVAELGNCTDKTTCRTYCDDAAHTNICLAFAEKHNLMSSEELKTAKRFTKIGEGPGGCTTKDSCKNYCDDVSHINECIAFAEQNGIMSANELAEAKKVQAAIAKGVKPPACGGKDKCDAYCSEASHMEECVAFGKAAGLMSDQEIQDSEKVLTAIRKGVKPPACNGKEECNTYCRDAAHMEECMTFAQAAGFMSPEEAQSSQQMLQAIKKGAKPPACNGKEECEKYCNEESHIEECIAFSEAAGMMNSEEAAIARKTGGKGPGGCTNKEECQAFCNNPTNQEICFSFGKDHGMIPAEDLKRMEEGKQQLTQALNQAPPEAITCISNAVGSDTLEKLKSGTIMPSQDLGNKMGECFRQTMSRNQGKPGEGGFMPPAGQAGPGGCKECRSFCESNPEACANFRPGGAPQITPGERQGTMPGGSGQRQNERRESGDRIEMMPGTLQNMMPGDEKAVRGFLENMPINALNPICPPGASCGTQNVPAEESLRPGTETQRGTMMPIEGQGMQQPPQQFQPPIAVPPPPAPAPGSQPPAGGILYQAFQFLFR